jgi:hypothetical protein
MKISVEKDLVKRILSQENFYNQVPEYFFMKEVGSQVAEALSMEGGCPSCIENNLIMPAVMNFISHTINMYLDCGPSSCQNLKKYIKEFVNAPEDLQIGLLYKENDDSDIVELII